MKKKIIVVSIIALCLAVVAGVSALKISYDHTGGSTDGVVRVIDGSEYFSNEDINAAMDAYIKGWQTDPACRGNTLTKLAFYDSTYSYILNSDGNRYSKDRFIVLRISFDTSSSSGEGFNPNDSYKGYTAFLSQSDDGRWIYGSWGGFY